MINKQTKKTIFLISSILSLSLISFNQLFAGDYPFYRDGILTIPRVDADQQPGLYRNGVLQFDQTINAFRLLSGDVFPLDSHDHLISQVELIVTESSPVQVFLKISGMVTACTDFKISQRLSDRIVEGQILNDRLFEVVVSSFSTTTPETVCIAVMMDFERVIPLQVFELSAGIYEYVVNGTHTGTFDLKSDNVLSPILE